MNVRIPATESTSETARVLELEDLSVRLVDKLIYSIVVQTDLIA